jgi:hypothetical protein
MKNASFHPFETVSKQFTGATTVSFVLGALVEMSQWFEVTPLPDDVWEVAVKAENKHVLDRFQTPEPKTLISQVTWRLTGAGAWVASYQGADRGRVWRELRSNVWQAEAWGNGIQGIECFHIPEAAKTWVEQRILSA